MTRQGKHPPVSGVASAEVAVDSSVAIPLLSANHVHHRFVRTWAHGRVLALTGHSAAETYSVLTRLPLGLRAEADDAARLMHARFTRVVLIPSAEASSVHLVLSAAGIRGGAVYDALVALAARAAGLPLATRDARARATYEALGVRVDIVPSG